ncbi:restriction endonuclease, partial [Streptomyces sp. NPDC047022]|uniref:restriction endonuclease n=1 Tax=Streptomyces sp. NPDC047022 TaxID=3155737 RepID=UPI0033E4F2AF
LEQFPQLIWHETLNDPHDARLSNTPNETTSKPIKSDDARLQSRAADVAVLVTTSTFTKAAAQYGDGMGIGLYDGDALGGWASRTGPAPWH